MGKRGHRGKKDNDGKGDTKPEKPKSVHNINDLFVAGGDIKYLGRKTTGPFTADVLQARYKHEGTTVDVDKAFDFKSLVTETGGGGSFSLFGTLGGDGKESGDVPGTKKSAADAEGKSRKGGGPPGDGPSTSVDDTGMEGDTHTIRDIADARTADTLKAAAVKRRAAAVSAAVRAREMRLKASREAKGNDESGNNASDARLAGLILGIQKPDIINAAKRWVRPYKTEQEMVEQWHRTKEDNREEYKRKRRQALRRQKSLKSGSGFVAPNRT
jgi:hypothetical protein